MLRTPLLSLFVLALALGLTACDAAGPDAVTADAKTHRPYATLKVRPAPVCENSFYLADANVYNLPSGVTVTGYRWYKDGQLMAGEDESGIAGAAHTATFTHSVYAELSNGNEVGNNVTVDPVNCNNGGGF